MATFINLYRKLLFVNIAFFNNMRIERDQDGVTSVTVTARVKKKESQRCHGSRHDIGRPTSDSNQRLGAEKHIHRDGKSGTVFKSA